MSKAHTNPNTNPKTLMAGILTLNDRHGAFESFCAPVFCDFLRNYFLSDSKTFGLLDTSFEIWKPTIQFIDQKYYSSLIHSSSSNPRHLWRAVNSLLHRKSPSPLPT